MSANRKADVAKAGKRHGPYTPPPAPSRRLEIIRRTTEWFEDNQPKAYTDDIRESVESLIPGNKPIKLETIPGIARWDLMRAMRRTWHTEKGNES